MVGLSCIQLKKYFFDNFQAIFIVFNHVNASASMRLLVEIHNTLTTHTLNKYETGLALTQMVALDTLGKSHPSQVPLAATSCSAPSTYNTIKKRGRSLMQNQNIV